LDLETPSNPIPEPGPLGLFGCAAGLYALGRKKRE